MSGRAANGEGAIAGRLVALADVNKSDRGARITDRDVRMLAFMAEHRFVLAAHLAVLLGVSSATAAGRLRALDRAGYVASAQELTSEARNYRLTRRGMAAVGSDLPVAQRVNLATYRHEAGVAWLALGAQRGVFGPLAEIVSERRMRSHDGRLASRAGQGAGDRTRHGSRHGLGGEAEPYGVRLRAVGRDGRDRLHYPDLVLVTHSGHRVAFELELTSKDAQRRDKILAAYAREQRIDAVVYLADHPARKRAIEQSVRRLGIGDRVRVESVTLGHQPGGAPGARAASRSARRANAEPSR